MRPLPIDDHLDESDQNSGASSRRGASPKSSGQPRCSLVQSDRLSTRIGSAHPARVWRLRAASAPTVTERNPSSRESKTDNGAHDLHLARDRSAGEPGRTAKPARHSNNDSHADDPNRLDSERDVAVPHAGFHTTEHRQPAQETPRETRREKSRPTNRDDYRNHGKRRYEGRSARMRQPTFDRPRSACWSATPLSIYGSCPSILT
jgi:hypothetical protein